MSVLRERVKELQEQHNTSVRSSKLELVLFDEALHILVKIARVLTTPASNMMLLGVGGSGKQSLTRLAAYVVGSQCFQISISKSYNTLALLDDLKGLYEECCHSYMLMIIGIAWQDYKGSM